MPSNIGREEIVGASAPAGVDPGGDRVDALAIDVKRPQQIVRVKAQVRLKPPEGVHGHKERALHRTVVSPETDRLPRRIVAAAAVGKANRRVRGLSILR